jgi:hypothetical protein
MVLARHTTRLIRGAILTALLLPALSQCAPGPRYVTCDNDAVCHESGGNFRYCQESRCVECVTSSTCGSHRICKNGECAAD